MSDRYDAIVIGAGIAGSVLAHALSRMASRRKLKILLLERSLAEPQRIVGELLQPGGVEALREMDILDTVEGIGAILVHGYGVVHGGRTVQIPYPTGFKGRSFHHGRFVQALRRKAKQAEGVDVVEATVTGLVETEGGRVIGVKAKQKGEDTTQTYFADLTFIADGCSSNLRSSAMPSIMSRSSTKSYFHGAILEDVTLPYPEHGTVVLIPGGGPVLLYQIEEHDTRMLIDIKEPLPKDIKSYIETSIIPHLPANIHLAVSKAISEQRIQRMPNSFLPASRQAGSSTKDGCILIGDAWNMRHPLTGAGMTVALSDVVLLTRMLSEKLSRIPESEEPGPLSDWNMISRVVHTWHWSRKPLSSTLNILSVALYDLFGADDPSLEVLRTGCFKYFELGGECINGPVSLLSGVKADPVLLFLHFFAVAFYSIWVLFTHPCLVSRGSNTKPVMRRPSPNQYPILMFRSVAAFWTACIVFGPLVWSEVRWW